MDALYFRVSSDRQTSENQFQDLLAVAEKDGSPRDWGQVLTISPTASSRKKSGAQVLHERSIASTRSSLIVSLISTSTSSKGSLVARAPDLVRCSSE